MEDKTWLNRGRVKVYQGSQTDARMLEEISREFGPFNIIIDNGSHRNAHQIFSFEHLFEYLTDKELYIIEDTQTSYCHNYGGGSIGSEGYANSAMHYFKNLIDGLNYSEYKEEYSPTATDMQIVSITFFHNLIIIEKGDNTEPH